MATAYTYEQDFVGWLNTQAELLKTGKVNELDIKNLVEEIEAMGRSEKRELESRMIILVMHLLKWTFQPNYQSRSWANTINEQRRRIGRVIKDSPSLKNSLNDTEWFNDIWQSALYQAVSETGLDIKIFPEQPIWTTQQILVDDFFPHHDSESK
ncbi:MULTISPECIES: DUF29 domain-containing protein [unclassified Acinetobacter]|uniref:DUF29 domain-containing protein n=1 Tax=unclassified Acinetobacter TaxID=196816 RepID=UPI00244D340E|nr:MULTISPECIES: DUF29 domain-containing protein [unclassified Acinetobacter]MDH0031602.1 DUF29 domain-containing protein [Acinetobacter sp. GD04021]MDH0887241.1 DUF29 domain-containing protein [Acinetobacter sp. GD03873]MDH1083692.1 DUF29 domain-containing protein [Acinetobacter sp. GD03983]MDH2190564.1 DUF29 domain-containing protein [Acinetobacter sp. GD03645]MDH2204219.1 DUF29 domain-containing protein [Acinetobacter sp. GD03647]